MSRKTLDILLREYGPTMVIQEVAKVLRVSTKTIYRRLNPKAAGSLDIPSMKDNGRRLFKTSDVAAYIDQKTPEES